ncbi:glycosyltransferase [Marinobacter salicampi]|uniref:glycosyltransferase n=1 Tax=Marinobacter salicampi TaxID=435907 RepID=UPI00140E7C90|nr:glycosyltransferase [Marinobacter salicampi]
MDDGVDILMITYNRPDYTELSLRRLLETSDEKVRVWLWHNGGHEATLNVIGKFKNHPRLHKFHHSKENVKLTEPTNWLWENSVGAYVGKVDDDCLVSKGWVDTLRQAHEDEPKFGILGCWIYLEEDFIPEFAMKKIFTFGGGHRIMQNCWIGGSGYLMKRACIEEAGLINSNLSFTQYGKMLARSGWIHGWYYPFLPHEHMDDPRSDHSLLRTDEDLKKFLPLSAQKSGVKSLVEWQNRLARSARELQSAPIDPKYYFGWRRKLRGIKERLLESHSY